MDIKINHSYGSTEIVFEAENVKVVESISESIYGKKEDGKIDFLKRLGYDITNDAMDKLTRALDDIFEYRNREYDSSCLIERMFEKLPKEEMQVLLKKLIRDYETED